MTDDLGKQVIVEVMTILQNDTIIRMYNTNVQYEYKRFLMQSGTLIYCG